MVSVLGVEGGQRPQSPTSYETMEERNRQPEFEHPKVAMADKATLLLARKIAVVLGGNKIVKNVDFKVQRGELVGILGPSGSGKTTLLKALAGIHQAKGGKVVFDGRDLYEKFEELKFNIGYVPQDDVVPQSLRVERVLGYTAELRLPQMGRDEKQARIDGVIGALGLTQSRRQRVHRLSGGQRKRVSVGMELISRPDLIFADEPTSGLDPALERSLMEMFGRLAGQGRAVVVTTHIMSSLDLLDKVCVLANGRLCYFGPVDELKSFFEVDDFVRIYSRLDDGALSSWQSKYDGSGLRQKYLAP